MILPHTKAFRKVEVTGYQIPAFIHNGTYFFSNLTIYEDGRVDCWNFEDFDHFVADVQRGWVSVSVPDGSNISIHGLGDWKVAQGDWTHDQESFIEYAIEVLKLLNPQLENLYTYREKTIDGVGYLESGDGTIFREVKENEWDFFPTRLKGRSMHVFYRQAGAIHLAGINQYENGTLELTGLETTLQLPFSELEQYVVDGTVLSDLDAGTVVHIRGLGSFTVESTEYCVAVEDKLLEIQDNFRELQGKPTSIELYTTAYGEYANNPTRENKEKLRTAYEAVPSHQRMYVGDMDTKDIAVRMIIYGKEEIEHWSHYAVASASGEELPSIAIPKPNEDE